jgi:hypothetical protein
MKEVRLTACFPEAQYRKKEGPMLEISGFGTGHNLAVAMNRAFRSILENPLIRHKSPKWIYISAGMDRMGPIRFWQPPAPKDDGGSPLACATPSSWSASDAGFKTR